LFLDGSPDKLLEKDVSKQRISKDDAATARGLLSPTTKMDDLADVDMIIEAVPVRPGACTSRLLPILT